MNKIAHCLVLSQKTVRKHVANLLSNSYYAVYPGHQGGPAAPLPAVASDGVAGATKGVG